MFKFLTQGTKIMRMRSGIIAIATLAVLAAVITTLALSSFTAEAQGNPGAVANLQLTSTSAGELTVSWDAASPVRPPTTALTGPSPAKTTSHGRLMTDTSIRQKPSPPRPSRTSATTPSTRSACVLATTEANTKANPGVAHGPLPPSQ